MRTVLLTPGGPSGLTASPFGGDAPPQVPNTHTAGGSPLQAWATLPTAKEPLPDAVQAAARLLPSDYSRRARLEPTQLVQGPDQTLQASGKFSGPCLPAC